MIVFKKAAEQQLQASIDILQSKLVLRTLKKSAAGQNFRRAAWPRLFTSAEAVHEQIPVFFPDDTPTPFTYTAKNGRRREVSSVGGGVYHIFSPDRFDAQSFMSYLMHIAASNNELKPLLAYDTETSGLNTTRTTIDGQPPSVPWEVGWHAGAGVTSHLLRLPADGPPVAPSTGGPATQAAYFTTCGADRPLLVQFGGNDAGQMLAAALLIQRHVDGVDINLGCPQACACKGGYGAYLMDHPDRVRGIVETLVAGLDVPVTAKIRVFPDVRDAKCTDGHCNWHCNH